MNNFALAAILVATFNTYYLSAIQLDETRNTYQQLVDTQLISKYGGIRLHLGCGRQHLDGYINIDFPPQEHTVQTSSGADIFGDITKLKFSPGSIDEIRSHHLFEHFDRPTALALLSKWHEWLKIGGKLVIETPDLEACVAILASTEYNFFQKQITMRHLFGSHEASWAYHYDGWYEQKFNCTLELFGFVIINTRHISNPGWELIPNIIVTATKRTNIFLEKEYSNIAEAILKTSMVNSSETRMFSAWKKAYEKARKNMEEVH